MNLHRISQIAVLAFSKLVGLLLQLPSPRFCPKYLPGGGAGHGIPLGMPFPGEVQAQRESCISG